MLFTNGAYTKHQDIHGQESFRTSGFLYSALQSPIQYCMVTASDIEISSLLRPRPHVSGYFWIRNFLFPDTAIVHTHPANSQANPENFESVLRTDKFFNPITFRIRVDDRIRMFSHTMTSQNCRQYLPPKFKYGRRWKANSFCAPWAYFQSFNLYAVKCRSIKCWNKLCQKTAWHLQAFNVVYCTKTGRNNLDEQESNAVLDVSGLDLDEPVPGGTVWSIRSESGVNPNTSGRANSIWIRCDNITCGRGHFRNRKEKVADYKMSRYVWTGPKSKWFKTQQKIKDFLCNRFEFINLLWTLIFIKWNRCILEVQQDDKVKQLGKRSASQAHANIIFG